jgi:hypothetical protein
MTVELGHEILGQDFQNLQGGPGNLLSLDTLTVREVPSADWKTYLDQSVLYTPTSKSFRVLRTWQRNSASIEFASLDMDPLAELQPIRTRRSSPPGTPGRPLIYISKPTCY